MKTRNLLPLYKLIFFFLISSLILSCGKKPETIGLDLVDDNKAAVGNDTLVEVMVYSALEDSVISDETTVNVIGSMQTSTFGLTNASVYSHLRISDPNPVWGPNPVADSIYLYMVYDTAYGNINTEQTFTIYRATEDFYVDSTYYSTTDLAYDQNQVLAQHSFFPDLTPTLVIDSTEDGVDSSYMAAILKIPINDWFADTIFNLDTNHFGSNDEFINKFKGIYIRPDDVNGVGQGAILSYDLVTEKSYLAIHYHNDTTDSLSYKFLININNARIGKYEHNYQLSQDQNFINQVVNKDTTLGNTSLYLQGLGGVKMILRFPGLEEMAGTDTRVINEAKLIFKSEDYSEELKPPTTLYLFKYREDGSITTLLDQSEGENFFGGNFNANTKTYWFRMALEAQKILNDSFTFDGFVIYPSAKSIRPNELVMPGTNPNIPGYFRLEIIYTDTE